MSKSGKKISFSPRQFFTRKSKQRSTTNVLTETPIVASVPAARLPEGSTSAQRKSMPYDMAIFDTPAGELEEFDEAFGMTTWASFNKILRGVKKASFAFPILHVAVTSLLETLQQFDLDVSYCKSLSTGTLIIDWTMKDAQHDLGRVSQQMRALGLLLSRCDSSSMSYSGEQRLNRFAE
jgi:hypothetical protein